MNNTSNNNIEIQEQEINLLEVIKPYTKRWPWFIIGLILSIIGAYLFLKTQNNIYAVESTVLIKDSKGGSGLKILLFLMILLVLVN